MFWVLFIFSSGVISEVDLTSNPPAVIFFEDRSPIFSNNPPASSSLLNCSQPIPENCPRLISAPSEPEDINIGWKWMEVNPWTPTLADAAR